AALWSWRRMLSGRSLAWSPLGGLATGVFAGLAALAKLNGALAMIVVAAWAAIAMALPRFALRRKLAFAQLAFVAGVVSVLVFCWLNPFVSAQPRGLVVRLSGTERLQFLVQHRVDVGRGQQVKFAHNALTTPADKLSTVVVQGFGRFGLLGPRHSDSTIRY